MELKHQANGKLPREVFSMRPLQTGRFSFERAHEIPNSGEVLVRISQKEAESSAGAHAKLVERRGRDAALGPAGFFEVEKPAFGNEFFLRMSASDAEKFLRDAEPLAEAPKKREMRAPSWRDYMPV